MAKTEYAGIDYSLGKANVDSETGIHYGVVPANEVGQAWFDESKPDYGLPTCPRCEKEIEHDSYPETCPYCEFQADQTSDFFPENPLLFNFFQDGYELVQGGDDTDIFILRSPYYTWCQYCSPCAPGAGYLLNWMSEGEGIKAYCLGSDWFEDGKAPYLVYRVEDNSFVE